LAQQYLAEQVTKARAAGVNARSAITRGEAADRIITLADREGADLVAIGTHGRSGVSRWLFGSVASRVLEACPVPVLFLHPKTGEDKGAPGPVINKILVPLDGSDVAASVIPQVEGLAKALGASLVFYSAVSPVTTYPGFETAQGAALGTILEEMVEQAKALTARAAEEAVSRGIEATSASALTPPVDGILHAAEDTKCDLIAIATHGRGGLGRAVMGSVADGVVRRSADRPVFVIRPKSAN
jgi:nucleotide-binding universal stress UspA family protein